MRLLTFGPRHRCALVAPIASADAAAAGSRRHPAMPGRPECRLRGRLGDQARMRVPERRPPARTLHRHRAPQRPRSRHHRADPVVLGRQCAGQPAWPRRTRRQLWRRRRQCIGRHRRRRQFPGRRPANAYALQPISVQGQTGLNVAAGIAGIELQPVRSGPRRHPSPPSPSRLRRQDLRKRPAQAGLFFVLIACSPRKSRPEIPSWRSTNTPTPPNPGAAWRDTPVAPNLARFIGVVA